MPRFSISIVTGALVIIGILIVRFLDRNLDHQDDVLQTVHCNHNILVGHLLFRWAFALSQFYLF